MAIGGRGIISVASNEVPAEMVQMVEAAERGDFATARRWHQKLLPLMQINFIESSPGPVKFAMAAMGLCEESYRLPMVPPQPASQEKILERAPRVRPADRRGQRRARGVVAAARSPVTRASSTISRLFAKASARTRRPRATRSSSCSARSAAATCAPPSPIAASPSGWRVNAWVKQGILLGFRFGDVKDVSADHGKWPFYDKDTMTLKKPGVDAGVRIVPGGSTIREGAFVARRVVCMPPMYVNIGAYVDEGTLVDSHALVGSCAQIGKRVHLSAGRADRRRDRARRRAAGHRRRRRAGRREYGRVRGRRDQDAAR